MHEATVAKSVLDIAALRLAKKEGACLTSVQVRLGAFTNVDPESLEFAFDALKKDHFGCSQARLDVQCVEAEALCFSEKHRYIPTFEQAFACPVCGSGIGELISGDEMEVVGCTILMADQEELKNARISG